jgi:hypothetical protein
VRAITSALTPDELLARMAGTLREQIGPSVGEPFARTQAFMAAVILEKLAGQLRSAAVHAEADRAEREALIDDLVGRVGERGPARLRAALAGARDGGDAALSPVIEALYADRDELGDATFDALLGRVRATLRARLDRQLEYAS